MMKKMVLILGLIFCAPQAFAYNYMISALWLLNYPASIANMERKVTDKEKLIGRWKCVGQAGYSTHSTSCPIDELLFTPFPKYDGYVDLILTKGNKRLMIIDVNFDGTNMDGTIFNTITGEMRVGNSKKLTKTSLDQPNELNARLRNCVSFGDRILVCETGGENLEKAIDAGKDPSDFTTMASVFVHEGLKDDMFFVNSTVPNVEDLKNHTPLSFVVPWESKYELSGIPGTSN